MPLKKYISRISYLDALIRTKATGTPQDLAKKMNLSEPSVLNHIRAMKEMGCPIKFCRKRNSYHYTCEGKVVISFFNEKEVTKISGGG